MQRSLTTIYEVLVKLMDILLNQFVQKNISTYRWKYCINGATSQLMQRYSKVYLERMWPTWPQVWPWEFDLIGFKGLWNFILNQWFPLQRSLRLDLENEFGDSLDPRNIKSWSWVVKSALRVFESWSWKYALFSLCWCNWIRESFDPRIV